MAIATIHKSPLLNNSLNPLCKNATEKPNEYLNLSITTNSNTAMRIQQQLQLLIGQGQKNKILQLFNTAIKQLSEITKAENCDQKLQVDSSSAINSKNQISADTENPLLILHYFYSALSGCMRFNSTLNDRLLRSAIDKFELEQFKHDLIFSSYLEFLRKLVLSNVDFARLVFGKIIRQFKYEPQELKTNSNEKQAHISQVEGQAHSTLSRLPQLFDKLQQFLFSIRQNVSLSLFSSVFCSLLFDNWPFVVFPSSRNGHYDGSTIASLNYIDNMLRICSQAPELCDRILMFLFNRLVRFDVELVSVLLNLSSINQLFTSPQTELTIQSNRFGIEISSSIVDILNKESKIEIEEDVGRKGFTIKELCNKLSYLDSMMLHMFRFLDQAALKRDEDGDLMFESVFIAFLRAFEESSLLVHNSTHAQFLIYKICISRNEFAETFIKFLLEIINNFTKSFSKRKACCLYLASFLVYAKKFLRRVTIIHCFEVLLLTLHRYLDANEPEHSINVEEAQFDDRQLFYNICQAVFYIFCNCQQIFRSYFVDMHLNDDQIFGEEYSQFNFNDFNLNEFDYYRDYDEENLIDRDLSVCDEEDYHISNLNGDSFSDFPENLGYLYERRFNFRRLINSRLNPFRFCLDLKIATRFADLLHSLNICKSSRHIIEINNLEQYRLENLKESTGNVFRPKYIHERKTFLYPFDLFLLNKCSQQFFIHNMNSNEEDQANLNA